MAVHINDTARQKDILELNRGMSVTWNVPRRNPFTLSVDATLHLRSQVDCDATNLLDETSIQEDVALYDLETIVASSPDRCVL